MRIHNNKQSLFESFKSNLKEDEDWEKLKDVAIDSKEFSRFKDLYRFYADDEKEPYYSTTWDIEKAYRELKKYGYTNINGRQVDESILHESDEEYVIDDEETKKYAEKYQKSQEVADSMFNHNFDPYSQPQEVINIINKERIFGCKNYQQLLKDYETGSDWYMDVIKEAQRRLALKNIKAKEKEEKDAEAYAEKEYKSAKRELSKLRKEHSLKIDKIDYLFNFIKDYESKHGITESSRITRKSLKSKDLHESYAIVSYYKGFDEAGEKTFNGKTPKAVEAKVKRLADRDGIEIESIRQVSADLKDSEYLNSLGSGIQRFDYNNSTFEESNLKEETDNKEWEEICKEFCRQIKADLLFVNNDNFGYMDENGNTVHMYADELAEYLKNKMNKNNK